MLKAREFRQDPVLIEQKPNESSASSASTPAGFSQAIARNENRRSTWL